MAEKGDADTITLNRAELQTWLGDIKAAARLLHQGSKHRAQAVQAVRLWTLIGEFENWVAEQDCQ